MGMKQYQTFQIVRFADQSNEFTIIGSKGQTTAEEKWYVDSGCTRHICCVEDYFYDYTSLEVE